MSVVVVGGAASAIRSASDESRGSTASRPGISSRRARSHNGPWLVFPPCALRARILEQRLSASSSAKVQPHHRVSSMLADAAIVFSSRNHLGRCFLEDDAMAASSYFSADSSYTTRADTTMVDTYLARDWCPPKRSNSTNDRTLERAPQVANATHRQLLV